LGAEGGEQHGHAGAYVGRLDALAPQPAGAGDDRAVGIAHDDVGAHEDQLVGEDEAVLEHPLVHENGSLGLRGEGDGDRGGVGPGVRAAAMSAFSVAITEGSSMKTSVGRRPRGAVRMICPLHSTSAPIARKASRWGSSRRRPMTSPPGGGMTARPKRASSGPASRKEARMSSASSASTSTSRTPAAQSASS